MLDPQTMQVVLVLVAIVFFVVLILGLFYGLFLLAKIRRQAVGINQRLDELLARSWLDEKPGGNTGMSL